MRSRSQVRALRPSHIFLGATVQAIKIMFISNKLLGLGIMAILYLIVFISILHICSPPLNRIAATEASITLAGCEVWDSSCLGSSMVYELLEWGVILDISMCYTSKHFFYESRTSWLYSWLCSFILAHADFRASGPPVLKYLHSSLWVNEEGGRALLHPGTWMPTAGPSWSAPDCGLPNPFNRDKYCYRGHLIREWNSMVSGASLFLSSLEDQAPGEVSLTPEVKET